MTLSTSIGRLAGVLDLGEKEFGPITRLLVSHSVGDSTEAVNYVINVRVFSTRVFSKSTESRMRMIANN